MKFDKTKYKPSTEKQRKRDEHLRNHYRELEWLNKDRVPSLIAPQAS